eukprot:13003_1
MSESTELFTDCPDEDQFWRIFKCIQQSELTKNLNVICFIIKEIAEYATKRNDLTYCAIDECQTVINITESQKQKEKERCWDYDFDSNDEEDEVNGEEKYKFCCETYQFFCFRCMDDLIQLKDYGIDCNCRCDCGNKLIYEPEPNYRDHCKHCGRIICGCNCACCEYKECWKCDTKCCENDKCWFLYAKSGKYFCNDCKNAM